MAETTPLVKIQRYTTDGAKCPDSTAISNCKVRNAEILDTSTSWTMDVAGYSKLTLQIDHTFAAATAITVTCEGSINGGTTYGRLTSTSVSSGTGTVSAYTDSYATGSASSKIILEYGIAGYDHVRCDLGDTAATTDLDTIYANASVGG
jgi:hypothetical protein